MPLFEKRDAQVSAICAALFYLHPQLVVDGAATGMDTVSHDWAVDNNRDTKRFPVMPEEWDRLGRRAGAVRNARMLAWALETSAQQRRRLDALVAPGGPGTADMTAKLQAARRRRPDLTIHTLASVLRDAGYTRQDWST